MAVDNTKGFPDTAMIRHKSGGNSKKSTKNPPMNGNSAGHSPGHSPGHSGQYTAANSSPGQTRKFGPLTVTVKRERGKQITLTIRCRRE